MKDRLASLDLGRALAITAVVALHLSYCFPALPQSAKTAFQMGQYGVQLFFVISAITVFMTLRADAARHSSARVVVLRFYVKRFFRIAPFYYCAIVVYAIIDWFVATRMHSNFMVLGKHDIPAILANVFFVHALVPDAINNVVPGGWSIGVEMFFYAIAPALFYCIRSASQALIVAVLAIGICAVATACAAGGELGAIPNDTYLYFWPGAQIPCFMLALCLWAFARERLTRGTRLSAAQTTLACAVLVSGLALAFVSGVGQSMFPVLSPICAAAASAALIVLMSDHRIGGAGVRYLLAIGQESYGIYIWHFIFVFVGMRFFGNHGILAQKTAAGSLALYPALLIASLALSYGCARLSDRIVQQPANRLAKRILAAVSIAAPAVHTPATASDSLSHAAHRAD